MYPVTLTGDQISLREFSESDLDKLTEIVGDNRVTDWLSYDSRTPDQARTMLDGILQRARIKPRTEYYLVVTPRDKQRLIGFARLGLSGVQAAKLGYAIHYDHWGNGYATEAARLLVDFALRQLDLHRVSAATAPDNAASTKVVTNLGFKYEGRLRHHVFTNGEWRDSLLYSTLAPEWEVGTAAPGGTQLELH